MFELAKRVVVVVVALVAASCADSEVSPNYMGNTNWLVSCDESDDCSDGLSCECGVCTKTCSTSDDCSSLDATCDTGSDALVGACGSSLAESLCLPECEGDDDCGGGRCVDAHCLPAPMSVADGGGASGDGDGDGDGNGDVSIGCGTVGAFVSASVRPDAECVMSPDNPQIPIGAYDVSAGARAPGGSCDGSYVVSLLVYSCLRGIDDTLQIHSAEVRLMDVNHATIAFDRAQDALPNPFLVTSNATIFRTSNDGPSPGIAAVETIPSAYAEQLDEFDGQQLLAEITLFGTTLGDVDVELRTFTYPIQICYGCLTICGADIDAETDLEALYGEGLCRDNASADGRICIDASCTTPSN